MKMAGIGGICAGLMPTVVAVGIAAVAGFGLGRMTAPEPAVGHENRREAKADQDEPKEIETSVPAEASHKKSALAEDVMRAASLGSPRQRDRAMDDVLDKANLDEVKKALAWAEALPEGPMKKAALEKILERWGELDGAGATAYGMQFYNQTGNPGLLRDALEGWARKDPQAAISQLPNLAINDRLQNDIRRDLVGQWTEQNPLGAAAYAGANRETNNWRGLAGTVADEWTKRDPKAATEWSANLAPGLDKRAAIYQSMRGWVEADPNGAAAYVSAQPPGESRDTMATSLARQIGQEDPAAGLKWAALVADPGTQERAVAGALVDLYRKNSNQALQLLQSSGISSQVQQAALGRMTNRGPWWR